MSAPLRVLLTCLIVGCWSSSLIAQGVLLPAQDRDDFILPRPGRPIPPQRSSYRIEKISVDAQIRDQIARTTVSQTFRNTGSRQLEVSFVFPLPYDGAVDRLTFLVDGKEIEAKLMDADRAREIYQGYVMRNRDPALLEWVGTGMFKTSVFPIPAGADRTVTLRYSQLLRKDGNALDYLFPMATARYTSEPVEQLNLRVAISDDQDLKNIYSPSHDIKVDRDDERNAVVSWSRSKIVPNNDFRLVFGTDNKDLGANLISYWPDDSDQGYFVLLASPKFKRADQPPQKKTIVLVLDRSGSMNGKKIDQARNAAKYVLNNLKQDDLFNVIAYDSEVEAFVTELERYGDQSRPKGIGFINSIQSGGSTNIDGALAKAFAGITDGSRPSYIVFLTDGLPTAGETNELRIVRNAVKQNRHRTRLISFGVGYDVNSRLLDRLTRENFGQGEYVRPDEDIEVAVSRLYDKISSPVMSGIDVKYEFDDLDQEMGKVVNRVYPAGNMDLFAEQQLVIVGRYRKSGDATIKIQGNVDGEPAHFKYNVKFADRGQGSANRYVEQIWAARRIGEIIDLIDLEGQNKELMNELVDLSKSHGILTPYTAFLADENQDARRFASRTDNFGVLNRNLESLNQSSGREAFYLRRSKQMFKSARAAPSAASGGGGGESMMDALGLEGGAAGSGRLAGMRKNSAATVYKKGQILLADNVANVDLEKEEKNIIDIKLFSPEYFKLIKDNTTAENQMLAAQKDGEQLIVRLRGKIYRFK